MYVLFTCTQVCMHIHTVRPRPSSPKINPQSSRELQTLIIVIARPNSRQHCLSLRSDALSREYTVYIPPSGRGRQCPRFSRVCMYNQAV